MRFVGLSNALLPSCADICLNFIYRLLCEVKSAASFFLPAKISNYDPIGLPHSALPSSLLQYFVQCDIARFSAAPQNVVSEDR